MKPLTTPSPSTLREWDCRHVWHAFTQMQEYEPFIVERAEGCRLTDVDGNVYLDGVSSLWCNLHGHRHPKLDAAIVDQLGKVAHFTNLGGSNPTTIAFAKRLVEISPHGLEHVFFSDSGASAVEVALKMAFQYWQQVPEPQPQKTKFLALDEAYHGDTIGSVSVGAVDQFHATFRPLLFDTYRAPAPDTYRLPAGVTMETATAHYLAQAERVLAEHAETIAGVIVEPLVQGAAGMIMHPPGYLAGLRALTKKYGTLLIADEVAVGFGRTGTMFACEHEQVTPDILCLGKGITAGYLPVAATLATDEVFSAFLGTYASSRTFFHGHTYGGNPLGCAVGLASLDVFEEERTLERLAPKIDLMRERLLEIAGLPHVGHVRQCGFIAAIELVRDVETREPFPWQERRGYRVCEEALRHGVWIRPLGNVIIVMPPLSIEADDLDQIFDAVEYGIAAATRDR